MPDPQRISLPFELEEFGEILDVRSPGEFAEDHLPGAKNLPVLSDAQRVEVGTLFRKKPLEARRLGAAMISRNIASHLDGYLSEAENDFSPLVYCWRGGMRSGSLAQVLGQVGWRVRVLEGGYQAWRRHVLADLTELLEQPELRLTVLAGLTGVGKTRVLEALEKEGEQVLDLEGLARHRGSLLGGVDGGQPSQKAFEGALWEKLKGFNFSKPVLTEAESNRIGKLHLPPELWKKLGAGRVVELQLSVEDRAGLLLEDYQLFTDNPERLVPILDKFRSLRGHEMVDRWQGWAKAGQWRELVESLLRDHYDLSYRRPGGEGSVYAEPAAVLELPGQVATREPTAVLRAALDGAWS